MAITKNYYANAQGLQLRDFMKEMSRYMDDHGGGVYTIEEGFFLLNAVKYKVRAGLKENNSFEKDMEKYKDYKNDIIELGYPENYVVHAINCYVDTFHKWKGERGYKFENFMESEGF